MTNTIGKTRKNYNLKKLVNKVLGKIFCKSLLKNKEFFNLHKGQSCYIFGNGKSLQYYDLEAFNDKLSIGCNALFAHKDINKIDLRYYYIGHPLFFYHFWKNPYSNNYEKNKVGAYYRRKINQHPDLRFFVPLNNYFGIRGENINYVHHFGERVDKLSFSYKMDNIFTMMTGSLTGMLGMAMYMGFSDITLVGCDYTLSPSLTGHFYESHPIIKNKNSGFAREMLNFVKDNVTIRSVAPDNTFLGDAITSVTYKELTNKDPLYRNNLKLILKEDLEQMNHMDINYKIY